MTKIMLVAEKITDQMTFISMLRKMTNKTILEIRENIIHKKPFFEGFVNKDPEKEKMIQEILRYAKKQGDKIKILKQVGNSTFEISEEVFQNGVKMGEEIDKQFEEEDEMEARNEENE